MDARAEQIMECAVLVSQEIGYANMTRAAVAERARCSTALVNHYWGEFRLLQDKVMKVAVERELLPIIAQGLLDKHPAALFAPRALQERAASALLHR